MFLALTIFLLATAPLPLIDAAKNVDREAVRSLLKQGANVNATQADGTTALHWASYRDDLESADLLIRSGANVNARAARGQTALMWAVAQKHPEVVKVLIANGADIHARSDSWTEVMAVPPHGYLEYNRAIPHGNDTALMFAARVDDLASAKL